jgi:hypothetical protein
MDLLMTSPSRYSYEVDLGLSPQSDLQTPYQPTMATMLNVVPFPIKPDQQYYRQDMYYNKLYEPKQEFYKEIYQPEYKPLTYQYRQEIYQEQPYRPEFNSPVYESELNPIKEDLYKDNYKEQEMQMQYNGSTAFHQMYQN